MSGNTARRTSITYPNGRVVDLDYGAANSVEDSFGLVKSVAISGESGNKVDYARAGLARFVKVAYPQPNVEMSMIRPGGSSVGDAGDPYDGFDRFSRVQEMRWQNTSTGAPIDAWQWGFNEASNRTWKKNLVAATGQDEAYGYDGLYQVIRDAVGTLNTNRTSIGGIPGEEEGFTYDPVGNWLAYRKDEDGSPVLDQTRANDRDNQLTQIDGSSQGIEYDRAGNAVKIRPGLGGDWTKHFELVWDAWNRLVEVKDGNGTTLQKNAYDGLFRRITKESGGEIVHTYWSDRWKPLEERIDSATTAARSYLWGERPGHRDELVLRDRDTNGDGTLDERLYATMDYFNGTAIVDASGSVLERYAYAAFGPRRVMGPDFSPRTASDFDWDFGFQGQFRDAETGWYNYGFRFYVPLLGSWVSRDPIDEDGGVNLYGFVSNDGINSSDYLGMAASCDLCGDSRRANKLAYLACLRRNGFDPDPQDYPPADEWDRMLRPGESRSNRTSWQNNEGNQLNRQNFGGIPDDPFAGGRKPKVGNGSGGGGWGGAGTVSLNDFFTNLTAGFGDALSFGVGRMVRDALGLSGYVDSSSAAYKLGQVGGLVGGLAGGSWSVSATRAVASGIRAVKVTSFASKGITPHLKPNTWVARGGPVIGYVRSGLWGGKTGTFSGPRFVGPGNSITDTIRVKFPSSRFFGRDGNWKSYTFGQFRVR